MPQPWRSCRGRRRSSPNFCEFVRAEPLLHWAVVCWESALGIWEMGGRQEPEQTLKGDLAAMMA